MKRNESNPVEGRPTNNVAEIEAIIRAIELAEDYDLGDILIKTDSEFVVKAYYNYLPNWVRNGWRTRDGSPVKNMIQFQDLRDAIQRNSGRMHVQLKHVWGHSSQQDLDADLNGLADELAQYGAQEYIDEYGLHDFYY